MTAVPAAPDRLTAVLADLARAFHAPGPNLPAWLEEDLTLAQVRTLFLIARAAPLPMGQLAAALGVSCAAASGLVERLERHGLVERQRRPDNRRVVECLPSAAGRRLLAAISDQRSELAQRTLGTLSPAELAEFARLVRLMAVRTEPLPA
jgi:DNA-binding MarR family transcriptional regulator